MSPDTAPARDNSRLFRGTRWRALLLVLATFILVPWLVSAYQGRHTLTQGLDLASRGDNMGAMVALSESMDWQCPLCPWPDMAKDAFNALPNTPPRGVSPLIGPPPSGWLSALAGLALAFSMIASVLWAYGWRPLITGIMTFAALGVTALALVFA